MSCLITRYKGFREHKMKKWRWKELTQLIKDRDWWKSVFLQNECARQIEFFIKKEVMTVFNVVRRVKARTARLL